MNLVETLLKQANNKQRQAITYPLESSTPLIVLAGAGSGKTSVLTNRLVYLVLQKTQPSHLLALTFTQAAAQEMQTRVLTKLTQSHISTTPPLCSTFHSLALRIIYDHVMDSYNWERLKFSYKPQVKNDSIQKKDLSSTSISFDQMLPLVLQLFKDKQLAKYYANQFKYILIDEFQDTNKDQVQFLEALKTHGSRLFIVGDDDQAIYGFRGATPAIMEDFRDKHSAHVIKLEVNYRSTPQIIQYANTLFKNKPESLKKVLISANLNQHSLFTSDFPVFFKRSKTSLLEAQWIVKRIIYLLKTHSLSPQDICILYRLNSQAKYYQSAFEHSKHPAFQSIQMMSIHKSKGLQFPVVFLVGLEDQILPYYEKGTQLQFKSQEEEKRIFYVGITRAESLLHLCYSKKKRINGKTKSFKTSPFLKSFGSPIQRIKIYINHIIPFMEG